LSYLDRYEGFPRRNLLGSLMILWRVNRALIKHYLLYQPFDSDSLT